MTLALHQVKPSAPQEAFPSLHEFEPCREERLDPSPDLASMILSLGDDSSLNIISLLECGAEFLNCTHLNYVETTDKTPEELRDTDATKLLIVGGTRELWLYGLQGESYAENVKIFTSLLSQQERRLRSRVRLLNLKDYSRKAL